MSSKTTKYSLLLLLVCTLTAYDIPRGWMAGGARPTEYDMGVDAGAGQNGQNAATIRSLKKEINGYGTLTQVIAADNYKGKRIRLTGYLKTKNVHYWAGLLMKVQGKTTDAFTHREITKVLCYDNMSNRFVSGTTDFTKYEIVLDVPDSASKIAYGARLTGDGQIWFDELKFEVVGNDVPLTGSGLKEPTNLDFSK